MSKKSYIIMAIAALVLALGIGLLVRKTDDQGGNTLKTPRVIDENEQGDEEAVDESEEIDLEDSELDFEDDVIDLDTGLDGADEFDVDDEEIDTLDEGAF